MTLKHTENLHKGGPSMLAACLCLIQQLVLYYVSDCPTTSPISSPSQCT
uniref:Uncharacterized protein n=1 Tax=Arundo donax TaxID=35708 RepID=A0A0A8Y4T1_ARUDO